MAPNKTLYVKDVDMKVWEEVEALAPGEVSALVAKLLRQWLADQNAKLAPEGPFHRLVVGVQDERENVVRKAFKGRELVTAFTPAWDDRSWDAGFTRDNGYWWAAVTETGNLVFWSAADDDGGTPGNVFEVFDNLDAAESSDSIPEDVVAAAAEALGEDRPQELDI